MTASKLSDKIPFIGLSKAVLERLQEILKDKICDDCGAKPATRFRFGRNVPLTEPPKQHLCQQCFDKEMYDIGPRKNK